MISEIYSTKETQVNFNPTVKTKKFFLPVSVLVAIAVICLSLIPSTSYLVFRLVIAAQIFLFIGVGVWNTYLISKDGSFATKTPNQKLVTLAALPFIIFFSVIILQIFTQHNLLWLATACSCAYILPFILWKAWLYYLHLQKNELKIWYEDDINVESSVNIYLDSFNIYFKLKKRSFDHEKRLFPVRAPLYVKLGTLFTQFIVKKNEAGNVSIQYTDDTNRNFGWFFYIESFYGLQKKYLDPNVSITGNKIRNNTVITVERVKVEPESESLKEIMES